MPAPSPRPPAFWSTPRIRSSSPIGWPGRRLARRDLIELAETLQAAVIDQGGRMNFPSRHPLNQTSDSRQVIAGADVILGLELTDFWGTVGAVRDSAGPHLAIADQTRDEADQHHGSRSVRRRATIRISSDTRRSTSRWRPTPRRRCPRLIEACRRAISADRRRVLDERRRHLADAHNKALERSRVEAAYAWNASPISTARLSMELWSQIRNEDWALVAETGPNSGWSNRLWTFDKHYQQFGGSGGAGVGYGAPAAIGAALANKKHGRLSVAIEGDGDFMYAPGVWWTAAHHQIPLLGIIHNNRAYHQEVMHVQRMANRHNRGVTRAHIGTTLDNPNIDFAKIVQGMGVHAQGPITNPNDLAPAIKRAVEVVKRGEPSLIDVVTQPR